MTEEKKNEVEEEGRRNFLANLLYGGGILAAFGGFTAGLFRFIIPKKKPPKMKEVLVAHFDEIELGDAKPMEVAGQKIFVVHLKEGYRVLSAICTHLGCIVQWQKENQQFFCPCHKGRYRPDGTVISGPPPRPLDHFRVEVKTGLVYVWMKEKYTGGLV